MIIDEEALQKRQREVMAPRDVRVPDPPLYLREIDEKVLEDLRRDAERYRFLRDEHIQAQPNWAADAQSNADYFDRVVDNRKDKSNA